MSNIPSAFPMRRTCPFDPPPELSSMRAENPVARVRIWDGSTPWLISRYADQQAALSDDRLSADISKPGFPHHTEASAAYSQRPRTFLAMDNPEHNVYRRMLSKDFTVKRMEALRPQIQAAVDAQIDLLLDAPRPADLVERFAQPVPSLVICELLGVPYADHEFFRRCATSVMSRTADTEVILEARRELGECLRKLVDVKNAQPANDLLSRLVVDQMRTGAMTRTEVASIAVLMLLAGNESTSNMIALGVLTLLNHPDQLAELRESEDPTLIANAVEELLRYLNVTHNGLRRVATEDLEIGGQIIKAGEGVIIPNDSANRDSAVFTDPDTFDIHRSAKQHIAFGYGTHQCIGQTLARIELQVVYGTLFRRIPKLRLAIPVEQVDFKYELSFGVHSLPVAW